MGALQFLVGVGNLLMAGMFIAALHIDKKVWQNWAWMLVNLIAGLFLLVSSYGNVCNTMIQVRGLS